MAYQNNNNNQEQKTVTTRGYRTSNPNAIKASAFEWDYQGDMLKLIITPELPENEQTEKRRYDYDNSWITCIARAKCVDLITEFESRLRKAINEGTECFVSVPVAEVNQFGIGIKPDGKGDMVGYVKLIRNINPTDLTSKDEIIYEFRKGELIVNYDNSTGKFTDRVLTSGELELFIDDMTSFVKASSKAFNHANRVVDKTYKDMVVSDIRAIGKKVGAEMSSQYSAQKSGAQYGQTSLFDNTATHASTENITSLDDLDVLPFN